MPCRSHARCLARVAGGLWLMTLTASARDWDDYRADRVEESAGGAAAFYIAPEEAFYGVGYTFGVRLRDFPALGSSIGPALFYDDDDDVAYAAPLFSLWLVMPRWRVAPYAALGIGYYYAWSDGDPAATEGGVTVGEIDHSHWALMGEAGLRFRLAGGRLCDIGLTFRQPFDQPEGEEGGYLGFKLAYGFGPD